MWLCLTENSETIRNLAIGAGVMLGAPFAIWRSLSADRQARAARDQAGLDRRTYVTDLFNRSVEQLYDDRLAVRLGAVHTLQKITSDFKEFDFRVYEIFSERVQDFEGDDVTADIDEILTFLFYIDIGLDGDGV